MKRRQFSDLFRWIGWGERADDACASWTHLLSLYADSQATPQQAQQVESHLEVCAHCRASLAVLRATTHVAAAWAEAELPPGLSDRLRSAIADEARRQRVAELDRRPARRRFGLQAALGGTAFTVALLAVAIYHAEHPAPMHTRVNPVIASNPTSVHAPTSMPGISRPRVGPHPIVAALPTGHHAVGVKSVQIARLPDEERPSRAKRPVIDQTAPQSPVVAALPALKTTHLRASHPVQLANADTPHSNALLHPRLKARASMKTEIANAVKPPVSLPRDPGLPDDDDSAPTPAVTVAAAAPTATQADTPVVRLRLRSKAWPAARSVSRRAPTRSVSRWRIRGATREPSRWSGRRSISA